MTATDIDTARPAADAEPTPAQLIATLYDDPQQCAKLARLRYVTPDEPGFTRLRKGKGWTYRDASGMTVADVAVRERISKLAIPPAWRNVWIAADEDAHLLAVGVDEKGRRQYIYHERWRSTRDELHFYRLLGFGDALPLIRADVDTQLRRRTMDLDRVLAAMLRIMDVAGLRVGNEVYAEENDSYGLSTLRRKHVRVHDATMDFKFPAKSGRTAEVSVTDAGAARVLASLASGKRTKRLWVVDREPVTSDLINARLAQLTGAHLTAKDFRTWNGTKTAFAYLREHPLPPTPAGVKRDRKAAKRHAKAIEASVVAAVDAAAGALGNTRSVARSHYVHPEVLDGYASGELQRFLDTHDTPDAEWLDENERLLLAFLSASLDQRAALLKAS